MGRMLETEGHINSPVDQSLRSTHYLLSRRIASSPKPKSSGLPQVNQQLTPSPRPYGEMEVVAACGTLAGHLPFPSICPIAPPQLEFPWRTVFHSALRSAFILKYAKGQNPLSSHHIKMQIADFTGFPDSWLCRGPPALGCVREGRCRNGRGVIVNIG